MVHKYVWYDDINKYKRVRVDLRLPQPLHEFFVDVAKVHGVTVNSMLVGSLVYVADADAHRQLKIERVPSVRVTAWSAELPTLEIPVTDPSPAVRRRWKIPKVL